MYIKLADNFVVRDLDNSLFDYRNFKIIKFNAIGFQLIRYILDRQIDVSEWQSYATSKGISMDIFASFLKKCEKANIISSQEQPRE